MVVYIWQNASKCVKYIVCDYISVKLKEMKKKKDAYKIQKFIYVFCKSVGNSTLIQHWRDGGNANGTTSMERNLTI